MAHNMYHKLLILYQILQYDFTLIDPIDELKAKKVFRI